MVRLARRLAHLPVYVRGWPSSEQSARSAAAGGSFVIGAVSAIRYVPHISQRENAPRTDLDVMWFMDFTEMWWWEWGR
jgi:hypothetical protein